MAKEARVAVADLVYSLLREVGSWSGDRLEVDRPFDGTIEVTVRDRDATEKVVIRVSRVKPVREEEPG